MKTMNDKHYKLFDLKTNEIIKIIKFDINEHFYQNNFTNINIIGNKTIEVELSTYNDYFKYKFDNSYYDNTGGVLLSNKIKFDFILESKNLIYRGALINSISEDEDGLYNIILSIDYIGEMDDIDINEYRRIIRNEKINKLLSNKL